MLLFILFLLFQKINLLIFTLNQFFPKYCFYKIISKDNEKITFNFATIGDKNKYINITLTQQTPLKKELYSKSFIELDDYFSPNLEKGKYVLCFIPNTKNEFKISFNIQSFEEDENLNKIATDVQLKKIGEKLEIIKNGFNNLENNSNNLMNTKATHLGFLYIYLKDIKKLTFAKIFIISLVSLFQIYVIQKMFGEEKRLSVIKTRDDINKADIL